MSSSALKAIRSSAVLAAAVSCTNYLRFADGAASAPSNSNSMKLEYFNIRGLAEVPRVVLKFAEVKFDDARLPFSFEAGKVVAAEFGERKAKGDFDANMGRVPVLRGDVLAELIQLCISM